MPDKPNPIQDWPEFDADRAYRISGKRLNELKAILQSLVRGDNVKAGPGLTKQATPDGFTLSGRRSVAGASGGYPFQVVTRPKPDNATILQAGVVLDSSLYDSLQPNDKVTITGLLNSERTTGWFDLIATDAIWLGITFNSSGVVTAAVIDSWGQGDDFDVSAAPWSENNSIVEDDGEDPPAHQASRKLIAYTLPGADGLPVVTQLIFADQLLRNVCIDGRAARYPFDHSGGYPL